MRRRYRIVLVAAFSASCAVAVLGLSALGDASEGPLSAALGWVGAAAGSIEHRVRDRLGGPPRRETMRWLEPYRTSAERLRKPDFVLLGAYDSGIPRTLDGVLALESRLVAPLPLVQVYSAWGDKPDEQFPVELLTAIAGLGSIPVVTWEPWLVDFENVRHPGIALRDKRDSHGLAAVARGTYDFYIDVWARAAARFGKPFFIRLAHEMNDPYRYPWGPQNNAKEEYIAAWRHIVDRFRRAGATNVVWVWSPHVGYEYWDLYYPGDAYADVIGLSVFGFQKYDKGKFGRDRTFGEILKSGYDLVVGFGKPVVVAELGYDGDESYVANWADSVTKLDANFSQLAGVVYFDDKEGHPWPENYGLPDWRVA